MNVATRPWHRHYDPGVPPNLAGDPLPLPAVLERTAAEFPDATAVVFLNRRMTYRELAAEVGRCRAALAAIGVRAGMRVAVYLPNLPQTIIAYYAVIGLGAEVVMTNPTYVEREIEHQWNDAGCEAAIVADFLFEHRIRGIRPKLAVRVYVITSITDYLRFPMSMLAGIKLRRASPPLVATVAPAAGIHFLRELLNGTHAPAPRVAANLDDVAVLQYTGGTTGVAKGAMLTHRNLSSNVAQLAAWFTSVEHGREVFLSALPFFHVFGMTVGMNLPVSVGAAMVIMPDPRDTKGVVAAIAAHGVTVFPGVPAQFNSINNHPRVERLDLTSVKACISGGAPLAADVRHRFETLTHGKIMEGFGLTETSPVTHANPLAGVRKDGSIGIPLPGTDAKIVSLDDGVTEVEPGAQGELMIWGPQVMKGYWNNPAESAAVLADGWLHTGDIATVDADGYFFIVGRKKDVIIASGYNIYPDEIDSVLIAHPAVLEAATIGVPDSRRGETVKSFVVLAPGAQASEKDLIEHCRQQLAPYKVPRRIELRASLPKSGALKILRRELRAEETNGNPAP